LLIENNSKMMENIDLYIRNLLLKNKNQWMNSLDSIFKEL
jgi:hypothetical protein